MGITISGCERKSTTSTTAVSDTEATNAAQSTAVVQDNPATDSDDTTVSNIAQYETQTITDLYSQDYQEALADANVTMKNQASFCNNFVEFSPNQSLDTANFKFFFESPSQSQWYWLGQKDNQEGKKRRMFAAKRDFSDVICTTAISPDKVVNNYADAYTSAVESGKIVASSDILKVTMTFEGDNWKITMLKSDLTTTSATISALNSTSATSPQTTTNSISDTSISE